MIARPLAGIRRLRSRPDLRKPKNVRDSRRIRGDVNVVLNRLVRDGVIADFQTTFDEESHRRRVRIAIVPGAATNPELVRSTVKVALERFSEAVQLSALGWSAHRAGPAFPSAL